MQMVTKSLTLLKAFIKSTEIESADCRSLQCSGALPSPSRSCFSTSRGFTVPLGDVHGFRLRVADQPDKAKTARLSFDMH